MGNNDNTNDVNQDYKSCSQQCSARICHLHNMKSCCGQRSKHEKNGTFVSGYVCKACWSTYNDCPCNNSELQGIKVNGTAHSLGQGAEKTIFTSSAALLQVDETKLNPDLCAWIPRKKKNVEKFQTSVQYQPRWLPKSVEMPPNKNRDRKLIPKIPGFHIPRFHDSTIPRFQNPGNGRLSFYILHTYKNI